MAYTSVLDDMTGNDRPKAFTVEGFVGNIPWAAASCGLNGLGGFIAGRVDAAATNHWPDHSAMPTLLMLGLAVALKAGAPNQTPAHNVIREIASGIAGWIGDDVFYGFRNWVLRPQWTPGTAYKFKDKVRHGGKLWEASKDIPASPTSEPGKDAKWQQAEWRAQGFRLQDLRSAAQAFVADSRRVDAVAQDVAEELARRGVVEDRDQFIRQTREVLNHVVAQFNAAA